MSVIRFHNIISMVSTGRLVNIGFSRCENIDMPELGKKDKRVHSGVSI